MQKQIKYKNWEIIFSACHQLTSYGSFAIPFDIGWFISTDVIDNKNYNFSFGVLCFIFHIEIWKWIEDVSHDNI